ncbi:MAG: sugar ABC transporter substrate-binding protein [Phototrophicales bacterium]|nr:MAG: sugar ABC transporter substrate-binding protein [Phototrophicales bacterium]RMG71826.1 MAG: sugar ABC transporter substrate-binding protein [Chloroflexota bacterium]
MNKRYLSLLLISVLLAVLALPIAAQDEEEETVLRWRTRPDNQAEIDVYTAVSEAIDAEWEGVSLVYEPGGSESASYQDVLITELEAGTAPDVFWIPGTDVARFAESGLILNLADIAAMDENFNVEDFYPGPMSFLTTSLDDGEALWGLPRDVSAFAIYYNADLFDEAGLDYPGEGDWTWDEFLTAAEEISALGDEIYGFGMNAWWANWGYFVNAAGSSFFNEDYTACGLDNEGTVTGLNTAAMMFEEGWAVPWGTDAEPPFLAGNVGMFMNGRWATPGVIANADFNWNVAPLPIGPSGEPTNWLFWGAYVVNANTENPEAAWELVTRLTSAEVQGQVAALGANIPSRATEEAIELFLNTLPDSGVNNQVFADGAAVGVTEAPLFFGSWTDIDNAYGTGVTAVFNGEMTAEEFASTICEQVAPFFDEME